MLKLSLFVISSTPVHTKPKFLRNQVKMWLATACYLRQLKELGTVLHHCFLALLKTNHFLFYIANDVSKKLG